MSEEGDKLLPIANVGRIMKQALPPPAKISKEAKQTMQECATEFIGFVTGEASDKCQKENRKTVNGDDIIWALSSLGFDNHAEVITKYLKQYREYEEEKAKLRGLGFEAGGSSRRSAQEQTEEKADEEALCGFWSLRKGGWKASELRHKLWYVLLKEKNMLMTQKNMLNAQNLRFPNPERISKVKKSMCRIKHVLTERAIEDPDPRRSAEMKRMINSL